MTSNGSWCWFSEPRAIYSSRYNRTYAGWVSKTGDIMARQIDHGTGRDITVNLHAAFNVDDHANPSFFEMPDGRVFIFYTHHQGADVLYRATMTGDIADLGIEVGMNVASFTGGVSGCTFSYANPVYIASENRFMVFFRQNFSRNRWCVAVNTDGLTSSSWSGYPLFDTGVASSGPYFKCCSNGVDAIDMLFTSDHPANCQADVYHARFRDIGGAPKWQSGTGAAITSVPFGPAQATKVVSASDVGNCWLEQIAYGADGVPVAILDAYPGNSVHDHRYRFKRLDGTNTPGVEICTAGDELVTVDPASGYYSGGACFDGNDPHKVYVARQDATGWRVERWDTSDCGLTWACAATISPADPVNKQFRPFSPKGYSTNTVSLFWWQGPYTSYLNYNATLRLIGWVTPTEALVAACLGVEGDTTAPVTMQNMAAKLRAIYQ